VDHSYETVLEAPEHKRRRIFDSFKTVKNAAEGCGRYVERMLLLEQRIEASRKIFSGERSVEITAPPGADEAVSLVEESYVLREIAKFNEREAKFHEREAELRKALKLAAVALIIADDCGLPNVQVDPPQEWQLEAAGEDPADGWCSTSALATKLRELAR